MPSPVSIVQADGTLESYDKRYIILALEKWVADETEALKYTQYRRVRGLSQDLVRTLEALLSRVRVA